jgi:uncharacterized protein (DUF4415 family)
MTARPFTDADLAEVADNPEWTEADMAKAVPFEKAFPELAAKARTARGPQKAPTKKLVSLRLSQEVIERFKADGPGWQSRIDAALRKAIGL